MEAEKFLNSYHSAKLEEERLRLVRCALRDENITAPDEEMEEKQKLKESAMMSVIDAIELMPDGARKTVLTYRYINNMKLHEIADKMYYSEVHVSRLLKKAVKDFARIQK